MRQDFSKVAAEQLATLFPVLLEKHTPCWSILYAEEAARLAVLFGKGNIFRITHIGSTAVCGLIAKPTVDILVEVPQCLNIAALTETMRENGYVVNTPQNDVVMYLKGYTPQGFAGQAFHIHVRYMGDWGEPYFRDYLRVHPEVATAYGELKQTLKDLYPTDRDAYTDAKGDFVRHYTQLARQAFFGRHRAMDE